jgi:hypothetical protein
MNSISPTPPPGSRIDPVIVISGDGSLMRFGVGAFVACWLGGWFFGFRSVLTQLLSGSAPGSARGYLFFWLAGWTLGGALAVFYLYRLLRSSVPETLTLKFDRVSYDSGIPPLRLNYYATRSERWKSLFPKRTIVELDKRHLASLRLRETDVGNRLTVDANGSRLDLAQAGSEIDREWLYQLLAKRYALRFPARREWLAPLLRQWARPEQELRQLAM